MEFKMKDITRNTMLLLLMVCLFIAFCLSFLKLAGIYLI